MPKENRKRGRREEHKKRKRDHTDDDHASKRHRQSLEPSAPVHDNGDQALLQDDGANGATNAAAVPFYGLLDDAEQDYFRKADELLEMNQFEGPEDRSTFIANVYKEAEGKELKIANSQSCSRFLERLILLSTPAQLKTLFKKFNGHFLHLVQHRFASHCCEALFIHAAPIVTQESNDVELAAPPSTDPTEEYVSMENLFLYTLAELEGNLGYLITDRFASHVLRVLLLILSGLPLEKQQGKSTLQSKKKENITISGLEKAGDWTSKPRTVPQAFLDAVEKVINDASAALDATTLRTLAEHPTGNPTLQLLLQLELSLLGKSRAKDETSLIRKLLPDDPITPDTDSASFINGLVYSTVGSRLLETIIQYAPGKMFKAIYAEFFEERMGSLARNEIAAYIASKILERLNKEDLQEAAKQIAAQIPGLVERGRTAVIKTLIERCAVRGVDNTPIRLQLQSAYSGSSGFDIARLLKLQEGPAEDGMTDSKHSHLHADKVHGSLLAQAMMGVPGPLGSLIFDSLAKLGTPLSLQIARDPTATRALQAALISQNASVIFRRKVIQQFYGHVGELALDPAGSHVIDAIWEGTHGLAFIRERIAEELAENEASLRQSQVGRAVWKNWTMDLYKRKRGDWVKQSRWTAGNDGFQSFPESNGDLPAHHHPNGKHLTAIEKARQKHAASKAAQAKEEAKKSKRDTKRERHATKSSSNNEKAPLTV